MKHNMHIKKKPLPFFLCSQLPLELILNAFCLNAFAHFNSFLWLTSSCEFGIEFLKQKDTLPERLAVKKEILHMTKQSCRRLLLLPKSFNHAQQMGVAAPFKGPWHGTVHRENDSTCAYECECGTWALWQAPKMLESERVRESQAGKEMAANAFVKCCRKICNGQRHKKRTARKATQETLTTIANAKFYFNFSFC